MFLHPFDATLVRSLGTLVQNVLLQIRLVSDVVNTDMKALVT